MKKIEKEKIKVWLITGCSSGFGKELSLELIDRDYKVIATARDLNKLEYLLDYAKKNNKEDNLITLKLDVLNNNDIKKVIEQSIDKFGKIDVLVNNAGVLYTSSFSESQENKSRELFDINFWSINNIIKYVLPYMQKNNNGTIINMSSTVGILANMGCPMYAASKHALEGLNEALRREIYPIRVMIVEPCNFKTDVRFKAITNNIQKITYQDMEEGYKQQKSYNDTRVGIKIIVNATECKNLPRRLLLGRETYESALESMKLLKKDIKNYKKFNLPCTINNNNNIKIIKLFNLIPILKIKKKNNKLKYYLFGFIPIINKKI